MLIVSAARGLVHGFWYAGKSSFWESFDKLLRSLHEAVPATTRWNPKALPEPPVNEPRWWPSPPGPAGSTALRLIDTALHAAQPLAIGLLVWGLIAWAARAPVKTLSLAAVRPFTGFTEHEFWPRVGEAATDVLGAVLVGGAAILIVLILFVMLILVVGNSLLYVGLRRLGYGLATTYVAGAGAPPWSGEQEDDLVIRLRIRPPLSTLRFELSNAERAAAIEQARCEASDQLQAILQREGSKS